ncbi:AAA domain-containing protein [Methylobacterium sp. WL116]|uniref:AAA domain-containing protein n=1 Tax=Methylobacterium sp. WL116 TaxID=2603889 RepID=UPI0011C8F25A|nr:AAA domain-containing protein [Methylobacterium sp. WL116]TXM95226.1 AAA family ATPase [Methylobacterium sp. WL116]
MKIKTFTVEGPLPSEIPALKEIEAAFPSNWMGFANVVVRHPTKPRYEREIDLILVTSDRIVMVDLKHWRGRLELVDGYWHQDGERRETSPVEKMRGNTILLRQVFEAESFRLGRPYVDGLVVLTHPKCDTTGLAQDAAAVLRIDEFLKFKDPRRYAAHFTNRTFHSGNDLTDARNKGHVLRFFSPGRVFEPRKTRFAGYEVVDPNPEFWTGLFAEYQARDVDSPMAAGLLRVWDFTKDDELRLGTERKDLLTREKSVIDHMIDRNPELAALALRPRAGDPDLGARHWELFDRDRHLTRLSRAVAGRTQIDDGARLELMKVLSSHVGGLHRAQVAHRDLGLHSVWVDPARARVTLSGFGAAWFPERRTIGLLRIKLLGAGLTLPEDTGVVEQGTAYHQDVFLMGLAAWRLLGGEPPPVEDRVPDWAALDDAAKAIVSEPLRDWFDRCLDWEPARRFPDGVAAHDALMAALDLDGAGLGAIDLSSYEKDVDPVVDYPVLSMIQKTRCRIYTTSVGGETLLVKNWTERSLGEKARNAARLIEFFARAERMRGSGTGRLPRVRMACLSQDGLFLLQDYLVGDPLEGLDVSGWSTEEFNRFSLLLIDAVTEAHELGVPHGDLAPGNILVALEAGPEPRIVDFLDFSTEAAGERTTLAYVPAEGGTDPFARDRYAAAAIVTEIAAKVLAIEGTSLATLSKAVDACADPEAPWTTLRPLADALSDLARERASDSYALIIGFPRCAEPGTMLADDGKYHVVPSSEPDAINLVGFDRQLVLAFDRATRLITSVRLSEATTQTSGWANRNKVVSIPGSVTLFASARISVDGIEALLAEDGIAEWAGNAVLAPPDPPPAEPPRVSPPRQTRFPTARFWLEQIRAEESLRPSMTLLDEVVSDLSSGVARAPHDSDAALEGVEEGDAVYFNGSRIGTVAADLTVAGSLAFKVSGGFRQLKLGDVLTIQPTQDAESLKRRSRAVRRILEGRTPIRDLVGYFDPGSKAEPADVGEPIEDGVLDRYGLNPDQVKAFHLLWGKGPVGLLQGPPGTGKTKFIAAFAHYALTEGGCRNVLLVSQSHEAVNTAAERIQSLMEDTEGGLDLLRVAKDPDKISNPLRRSHVGAVHDLYVARFEAEAKERLCMIARGLGLVRPFAEDFFEAYEGPVEIARQLARLREIEYDAGDEDASSLLHRIEGLEEALAAQMLRFEIEADVDDDPGEVERATVKALCVRHDVRDLSAVGRLRAVRETGREWLRTLRTKSRTLEEFLAGSRRLVCGTCVGVGDTKLRITEKTFDLVIVDEAARATSSELAVAMQSAHRVLLVGDHRQLPPNLDREIVKRLAVQTGITDEPELLRSDFERAFGSRYGQLVGATLQRQYRMAPEIGKLVSDVFYPDVGLITQRGPPEPHYDGLPAPFDRQFAWVDSGGTLGETKKGYGFSNLGEAHLIVRALERLSVEAEFLEKAKVDLDEDEPLVGVICMYAHQRDLVKDILATSSVPRELRSLVKVETVDSYQGKENRIVIVSLVRSNDKGRIGFLDRENRINVALSRAMDRLVVVGAAELFRSSAGKLPDVLTHMEAAGRLIRSAAQMEAA